MYINVNVTNLVDFLYVSTLFILFRYFNLLAEES